MRAFMETACEQYRNLFDINFLGGDRDYTIIAEHITDVFEGENNTLVAMATFQANEPNIYLDSNEAAIKDHKCHELIMSLNDYTCDIAVQQLAKDGTIIEASEYKNCAFAVLDTYHTYLTDEETYSIKYAIIINADSVIKLNA